MRTVKNKHCPKKKYCIIYIFKIELATKSQPIWGQGELSYLFPVKKNFNKSFHKINGKGKKWSRAWWDIRLLAQTLQTNPFFAAYLIKAQYSCQSWSNCLCTACPIVVRVQPVYLFAFSLSKCLCTACLIIVRVPVQLVYLFVFSLSKCLCTACPIVVLVQLVYLFVFILSNCLCTVCLITVCTCLCTACLIVCEPVQPV